MSLCPAPVLETMRMTALLRSIDCEINGAVFTSYRNLFGGAATPLASALVAGMTLYVALIGFQLLRGRGGLSMLTPRALLLGLVLTFATSWPAYQTMVAGLLERGPDEIAQSLTGSRGSASLAFADRLDRLFGTLARQASSSEPGPTPAAPPGAVPDAGAPATTAASITMPTASMVTPVLVWGSALILLAGTIGVLVTAKIVLGILLAIGPLFILLALFDVTRPLFEGWLKMALLFALVPMLVTLCGSAALLFLDPVVAALVKQPLGGPPNGPVIALFLGSLVYLALMLLAFGAAVGIGGSWRARRGDQPPPDVVVPPAMPAMPPNQARNARVDRMVADISRGQGQGQGQGATSDRTRVIRVPGGSAAPLAAGSAPRRTGLGQRRLPRPTSPRGRGARG
jgi:type IV secretion system protein VirB6